VCIFTTAPTHLVADLGGWLPAGSPFVPLARPVRLLDTRDCIVGPAGPQDAAGATVCRPVRHAFPVAPGVPASYGRTHSGYPGTDIFTACGAPAVSPVDGVVLQVRRDDTYRRPPDNPALRGGRSIAILGDDGVRYYGAHWDTIDPTIVAGARVVAGQPIATVGRSGDTSVCHIHFGLSVPCPDLEWAVRRGLVWPWPYLDAWRAGREASPVAELAALVRARPSACADAMAMPTAQDAG
jgi:peptidoglycan LD-endopeptidase LytH